MYPDSEKFVKDLFKTREKIRSKGIMLYLGVIQVFNMFFSSLTKMYRSILKSSFFLHGKGRAGNQYRDIIRYLVVSNKYLPDSKRKNELIDKNFNIKNKQINQIIIISK